MLKILVLSNIWFRYKPIHFIFYDHIFQCSYKNQHKASCLNDINEGEEGPDISL
jgi:hypothetical protein